MKTGSYKDLIVWQKSIEMVTNIYRLTNSFPQSEIYGLIAQMRRAAVSIPSNIAEGSRRRTTKDTRHFLTSSSRIPRPLVAGMNGHSNRSAEAEILASKEPPVPLQRVCGRMPHIPSGVGFFTMAFGSGSELETQIEISKRLNYSRPNLYDEVECLLTEVMKMLNVMINK